MQSQGDKVLGYELFVLLRVVFILLDYALIAALSGFYLVFICILVASVGLLK